MLGSGSLGATVAVPGRAARALQGNTPPCEFVTLDRWRFLSSQLDLLLVRLELAGRDPGERPKGALGDGVLCGALRREFCPSRSGGAARLHAWRPALGARADVLRGGGAFTL